MVQINPSLCIVWILLDVHTYTYTYMNGSNPSIAHGDGKIQPFLTIMNAAQLGNLQFFLLNVLFFI